MLGDRNNNNQYYTSASQLFSVAKTENWEEKTISNPPTPLGRRKHLSENCFVYTIAQGRTGPSPLRGVGVQTIRFARISDIKFHYLDTSGPKVGVHFTSNYQCKLISHFLTRKHPNFLENRPNLGAGAVPPDSRLVRLCLCITLYPYQH